MDNLDKIINLEKKTTDRIIKILGNGITYHNGATSTSYSSSCLFIKHVEKHIERDVYKREKHLASILKKFKWYPELLYSDDNSHLLIFKNVGVPVTIKTKPPDFEQQFNQILADMISINVQHNDIKTGEILIDDNKQIYLCDFGWGSVNNQMGCGINIWDCYNKNKPWGYNEDSNTLKRIGLI